jgi:hypothetical protein
VRPVLRPHRNLVHVDADLPLVSRRHLFRRDRRRQRQRCGNPVPKLHFAQRRRTFAHRGRHDRPVDAHHPDADVAQLGEALQFDAVQRMDGEPRALHDRKAQQKRQQRAVGEAAGPSRQAPASRRRRLLHTAGG